MHNWPRGASRCKNCKMFPMVIGNLNSNWAGRLSDLQVRSNMHLLHAREQEGTTSSDHPDQHPQPTPASTCSVWSLFAAAPLCLPPRFPASVCGPLASHTTVSHTCNICLACMPTVLAVDFISDSVLELGTFGQGGHTVLQAHVSLTARTHNNEARSRRQPPTANRASFPVGYLGADIRSCHTASF